MRFGRWLHAVVGVAAWIAAAPPLAAAPGAPGQPPAGDATPERTDVPPWAPPPRRFAVVPFENRSGVKAFDWLVAGAPFEISQKTEEVLGLDPTGGPLHVGGTAVEARPGPIAAFAAARDAAFVITGWVERPSWQLRLHLSLWKVTGPAAVIVAEAQRTGEVKTYHQLLGDALAELWSTGGLTVDAAGRQRLGRALASDLYAVHLMGRGLGHLTGAIPGPAAAGGAAGSTAAVRAIDLKLAEHDLERAVFIDPKCFEAQRLLGELYLTLAPTDPKAVARAAGKFHYANDLAPDDLASLRAAAGGAARAGKHEAARERFTRLVKRRPWDLEARYELGAAMWRTGDPAGAERQLEQVTARQPDHLAARRVLVLIHASRSDTEKLVTELEAIAARAPGDLEIKADLASAYGALSRWAQAITALEAIAVARPADLALHVRIGDAYRKRSDLDRALTWYARAGQLAPQSSWPGFAAAQALFDAGKLAEASHAYTALQRYREDLPAAEQALGAIAYLRGRPDDAAWYLRRAIRGAPRSLIAWRSLIAAELARRDARAALIAATAALPSWPRDGALHYLTGVAHAMLEERIEARAALVTAMSNDPGLAAARAALGALDAGGPVSLAFTPELVRPWGDADALGQVLGRFSALDAELAQARGRYQHQLLGALGALNRGPYAAAKAPPVRRCPVARVAASWAAAQRELAAASRLGVELEVAWRFIARHDEAGVTASLLPNARSQVTAARKAWRLALADIVELRAEWTRGLSPELRAAGCTERLLADAVAHPVRYQALDDDRPEAIPSPQPPRPRGRATFYVDNSRCLDPVEVWVDGAQLGEVAAGRRSALVTDGGDRTLCLLVPGAAQCGDRGTVRQVYLHDGWSVTMHCAK